MTKLRRVEFLGDSLKCLRDFPEDARHDAGYALEQVQRGKRPSDWKPMPDIGKGVEELRVWDDTGTYRVVYLARLSDAAYVLHAFPFRRRPRRQPSEILNSPGLDTAR